MKAYEEKSKSVFDRIEAEREHIKKRNKMNSTRKNGQ